VENQSISFILNNILIKENLNPTLPLLDFIRKEKHLKGTKEVCKEGDCGACTVLLGHLEDEQVIYKTITSCIYPIGNCSGKHVVTIEGINQQDLRVHQKAFADEHASQCGFCTPGFIMSLTSYLLNNKKYNLEKAINSLGGNICRCTGYHSIIRATQKVIKELNNVRKADLVKFLIKQNVIPEYFLDIKALLKQLKKEELAQNKKSNIFIGGGSDLFVQKADELLDDNVSFLSQQELNYIVENKNQIEIGGGTTFEEIKQSDLLTKIIPSIKDDIDLIASLPIRNSATLGGNLSNASPIGDFTIILLALNSILTLSNGNKERKLLLSDFYLDYKKLNKNKNEFIKSISFTIPQNPYYFSFEKVSKRTYLDIASVNSAILIEADRNKIKNLFVSAGGIAPIPKLLEKTNNFLIGKEITLENIDEALRIVQNEISPISDVRGSSGYKKLLLNQLIKAHFLKLFPKAIKETELI